MSNFPNLLIIGAMKSGTTSLHDYLSKHPEIFMSNPKEIHYYSRLNRLSLIEYQSHFKSDKKIRGTSPQSYSKTHDTDFKEVAKKIYNDTPDVKLIYIMRDPFKRLISHALENRYGDPKSKINQNMKSGHYWKTSLYNSHISSFLEVFKKEQIHLLTLEDLMENRLVELNKIFKFLGVSEIFDSQKFDYIKNHASTKEVPLFIKMQFWHRILSKLSKRLAYSIALLLIKTIYKSYLTKPSLKTLVNDQIIETVRTDSIALNRLHKVDISNWNLSPDLNE